MYMYISTYVYIYIYTMAQTYVLDFFLSRAPAASLRVGTQQLGQGEPSRGGGQLRIGPDLRGEEPALGRQAVRRRRGRGRRGRRRSAVRPSSRGCVGGGARCRGAGALAAGVRAAARVGGCLFARSAQGGPRRALVAGRELRLAGLLGDRLAQLSGAGAADRLRRAIAAGHARAATLDGLRVRRRRCAVGPRQGQLAFTQYCHYQYCMVYSIHTGGRGGGVPCAVVVQYYCNSMGIYTWGGAIQLGLAHSQKRCSERISCKG